MLKKFFAFFYLDGILSFRFRILRPELTTLLNGSAPSLV